MKLKRIMVGMFLFSLVYDVFAGNQTGTIEALHVRAADGLVYFTLKGGAKGGSPACATISYWMVKDENSAAGKRQYALLLAAHLAGRPIIVAGADTCTRWSDGEDVNIISLLP